MADRTFSWYPDVDSSHSCKPVINISKFGDGYELRVPNGINHMPMNWSLSFTRDNAESNAILDFLRERGGYKAFNWTTPNEETGVFVCREWNQKQMKGGSMQVTCSFEQVFEY